MKTIAIQDAEGCLSQLIQEALRGEQITLAAGGQPLVRLVPCAARPLRRTGGQLRGQAWEAPDCWVSEPDLFGKSLDSPLPGDASVGSPIRPEKA